MLKKEPAPAAAKPPANKPDLLTIESFADDLGSFDSADQRGLLEFVGKLTGGGGEEKERQDEYAACDGCENRSVEALIRRNAIQNQQRHGGLEQIVVQRAESACEKDRQKAA